MRFCWSFVLLLALLNATAGVTAAAPQKTSEHNSADRDTVSAAWESREALRAAATPGASILSGSVPGSDFPDGRYLSSHRLREFTAGASNAEYGFSVDVVPDLNGDGYRDLVVGAWQDRTTDGRSGAVYIYFGGPMLSDAPDVILWGPPNLSAFGTSVAGLGDFDGDGFNDLAVGAPWIEIWGTRPAGQVFVYPGGPEFGARAPLVLKGSLANDRFGTSVHSAGDVNADGFPDIVIGAPGSNNHWNSAGKAFVYFGGPAADATPDLELDGEAPFDYYGQSVAGLEDVNNDGVGDLIVGAWQNDAGGDHSGRAYVYFGGVGVDATADAVITGAPGEQVGSTVAPAGDVNGDGFGDFMVATQSAVGTLIFFGGPAFDTTFDLTIPGGTSSRSRGIAALGDVNGDGFGDLAASMGAGGLVNVYFGGPGVGAPRASITETASGAFGYALAAAGDLNGDGYQDLFVGAHQTGPGAAYLVELVPTSHKVLEPNAWQMWFGGTQQTIRWLGSTPADVDMSVDDGVDWIRLASNVSGGTIEVEAPNVTTDRARVRVVAAGQAPNPFNSDLSDAVHSIYRFRPVVVSPDGTGDATSIQEGLNLVDAIRDSGNVATSFTVMPGFYDEDLVITAWMHQSLVNCPAGPELTRLRSISFTPSPNGEVGAQFGFEGLGIVEPVHVNGKTVTMGWHNCRFEGGYISKMDRTAPNMNACEFFGRTQLLGYRGGTFDSLTFHGGTLELRNAEYGFVRLRNCTFMGPADTALVVTPVGEAPLYFENLDFKGVNYGIVAGPRAYGFTDALDVRNTRFEVGKVAITYDYDVPLDQEPYWYGLYLKLDGCEIVGGETAIKWTSPFSNSIGLSDVTISGQSGDAIDATLQGGVGLINVTIRDIGGNGLNLRSSVRVARFTMDRCTFTHLGGDGVTIDDQPGLLRRLQLTRSLIARAGGSALRVKSASGLPEATGEGVEQNTFAWNGGDGIRMDVPPSTLELVQNNIIASNAGVGLRTQGLLGDRVRHNDAWANRAGDYAGDPVSPENLIADPGFCDPLAGDWHVQAASPCAPSGPFGQIGALGVGCDATSALAALTGEHPINARSNAKLELRVPGHALLDVHRVQPESAALSGALPQSWRTGDSDGDGFDDLELEYRARDLNVAGVRGTVPFEAMLVDGLKISAAIPVHLVPRAESDADVTAQRFGIDRVAQVGSGATIEAAIATRAGSPGTLELFDVQGRRLVSRVVSPAGGERTVELQSPADLRRGVYFLRLSQLQERLVRKVVLVR